MKLNKELASVLADMEYLIGKECYNPKESLICKVLSS